MHAVRSAKLHAVLVSWCGVCSLLRIDGGRLLLTTIGKRSAGGQEPHASPKLSGWY